MKKECNCGTTNAACLVHAECVANFVQTGEMFKCGHCDSKFLDVTPCDCICHDLISKSELRQKIKSLKRKIVVSAFARTPVQDGKDKEYNQAADDILKLLD